MDSHTSKQAGWISRLSSVAGPMSITLIATALTFWFVRDRNTAVGSLLDTMTLSLLGILLAGVAISTGSWRYWLAFRGRTSEGENTYLKVLFRTTHITSLLVILIASFSLLSRVISDIYIVATLWYKLRYFWGLLAGLVDAVSYPLIGLLFILGWLIVLHAHFIATRESTESDLGIKAHMGFLAALVTLMAVFFFSLLTNLISYIAL